MPGAHVEKVVVDAGAVDAGDLQEQTLVVRFVLVRALRLVEDVIRAVRGPPLVATQRGRERTVAQPAMAAGFL